MNTATTQTNNKDLLNYGQNFANLASQMATVRGMDRFMEADLTDEEPLTGTEQATVAFHHNNYVFPSPALALQDLQQRNKDMAPRRDSIGGRRGTSHRSIIARAVRGSRLYAYHATKGWRDAGPVRG